MSSDFLSWVSLASDPVDPFTSSILQSWMGRYLGLKATAPEVIQGMANRPGEFEMVPVPKLMLAQLSPLGRARPLMVGASGIPSFSPTGSSYPEFSPPPAPPPPQKSAISRAAESIASSKKARHAGATVALLTNLTSAIEKGDGSSILGLVAEDYRDPNGLSKSQLSEAIERFFKITSGRRVILTKVDEYEAVGNDLVVVVSGAWQAEVSGELGTKIEADALKLELILTQDREGEWKIAAVRHG